MLPEGKGLIGGGGRRFERGHFYSEAPTLASVPSIFQISGWYSHFSGQGPEGILGNGLLLGTRAQDEEFTCREFVGSNTQADCAHVHAISHLFLGGRITPSLSPPVRIPVVSLRRCARLD